MKTPIVLALASVILMACSTEPVEVTPVTDVQEAVSGEVIFEPLAFTLPEGWEVTSQTDDHALISVPDSKYEVSLDMSLQSTSPSPSGDKDLSNYETTDEGITLYSECGGGICFQVDYDDMNYFFGIDVSSTEPVPENLDGIWTPTFDASADLDAFENSVHLAK